jgi:hypothetical protein
MNPYAAPGSRPPTGDGSASAPADAERDIAEASPPVFTRVAGGVAALAGIVVGVTGLQTMAMVSIRGLLALAPWTLVTLGAAELVLAVYVFRARAWGVMAAVVVGFLMVVASSFWLIVSVSHGLLSLYALGGPAVSLGAAIVALLALAPSQRATAARARLRAQGMDLGL